ncbi:rhomboid family intramembrane serine protease [Paenibacillaceae bacterium WGS1546]|uniref:rhomboid family intramembrane serine protease n=1 Tax=Cohnella sp. WGS1546 TaxID=3366810 RepID=UPI00372CF32C
MIFQRNEKFRDYIRLYPVTSIFLTINIVAFLLDHLILNRALSEWGIFYQHPYFDRYGLGEPWRYVTSIALHAGWEHLLFNCFSTLIFAPPLERLWGHTRYLAYYLVSGIAGNALSAIVYAGTEYGSLGASGAIYGLFGAYLYLAVFRKVVLDEATRKMIFISLIFGFFYSFLAPNVNIWAHLGGAIAGFALMAMYVSQKENKRRRTNQM